LISNISIILFTVLVIIRKLYNKKFQEIPGNSRKEIPEKKFQKRNSRKEIPEKKFQEIPEEKFQKFQKSTAHTHLGNSK
jgi:hypothetical protein